MSGITPLTYQILLALADGDGYGYGIIKEIEHRSGSASAPSTGALYLALQRMEGEGLIQEAPARPGDDARRRYYRLSAKGRRRAEQESIHLAVLVAAARDKKLIVGGAS